MAELHASTEPNHQLTSERRAITAERYISTEYMAHEWQHMWPQVWLVAGLARDVAESGEYFVHNLGRESILVTCDEDLTVRAFYNVCQHRGARVMVNERGWVRDVVCPYHGWTYNHAGDLTVVPDEAQFAGGVSCAERSLKPVRCEVWAGLVWVCMDEDAEPLADYLGPLAGMIEPYRIGEMTLVQDQTVRLNCNWKAIFDNFGELYHVEHIHPQHASIFDCPTAKVGLYRHGHTGVFIDGFTVNSRLPIPDDPPPHMAGQLQRLGIDPDDYQGRVLDVRADVQRRRRELGPELGYDYSTLSDEQLSDIVQFNVFPNTMITVQPDNMLIMRARPDPVDPNWCWWDKWTYIMTPTEGGQAEPGALAFSPRGDPRVDPTTRPDRDEFTQQDIIDGAKTMTITIDQDVHLIRDVQAGMHSRGFDTALLSEEEIRVTHFHHWLDHVLDQ